MTTVKKVSKDEKASFVISVNVECLIIPEYVLNKKKKTRFTETKTTPCSNTVSVSWNFIGVPVKIKYVEKKESAAMHVSISTTIHLGKYLWSSSLILLSPV